MMWLKIHGVPIAPAIDKILLPLSPAMFLGLDWVSFVMNELENLVSDKVSCLFILFSRNG